VVSPVRFRPSPSTRETTTCPRCGEELRSDAVVCRHCLFILDRSRWQHDAGRLGADDRGRGRPLEDPPIEPLPITGSGIAGGALGSLGALANSASRLLAAALLLPRRKRRKRG
jgi:hypothetical protein